MRVVISTTAALNGGDAAILRGQCATVARAVEPRALELAVFDQHGVAARRYYPELDLRPALFWMRREGGRRTAKIRWGMRMVRLLAAAVALRRRWHRLAARLCEDQDDLRDLETYQRADLVLTPGGTMLVTHYKLLPRLCDFAATLLLRRPLVFFTQSLGPFTRRTHRWSVGAVLRRARLVLVRGEESRQHVLGLGAAPDRVRVAPDAAFVLAEEPVEPGRDRRRPKGALRVAISVREWPFFTGVNRSTGQTRYEQAVASLCVWLTRERAGEILFLSTCQGIPEYWMDDSRTALRIRDALPADVQSHVAVDRQFHPPTDLRNRFSEFDVVVATRLHAAILALCGGTPVVVIEYERKATEAFARLGLSEWVVEIGELDGDVLVDVVHRLLDRREVTRKEVATRVAEEQRLALAVADDLRALLVTH